MVTFKIRFRFIGLLDLDEWGPDVESITVHRDYVTSQVHVPVTGAGDAGSMGYRLQSIEDRLRAKMERT